MLLVMEQMMQLVCMRKEHLLLIAKINALLMAILPIAHVLVNFFILMIFSVNLVRVVLCAIALRL